MTQEEIERLIAEAPGNAAAYSFDAIEPLEESPLAGGRMAILGSSVAYGAASMGLAVGEYLSRRLGCELVKSAVSGTTLVTLDDSCYIPRLHAEIPNDQPLDLFVCQLSTNDATKELPLGAVGDATDLEAFDISTVAGAIEHIVCYARQTWDCPIAFFTGSRYDSEPYARMYELLLQVRDKWVPIVCIIAPVLTLVLDMHSAEWFDGYTFSHERLILNALFTFVGMLLLAKSRKESK
jgi:hypothetical protein